MLQDGDLTLAESAAILTYLAETYGESTGLVPNLGTRDLAYYYQWCFFIMSELDAHNLYIVRKHVALKDLYGEAPNAVRTALEGFEKQARVADLELSRGGPSILGRQFTCADILLTTCLLTALPYHLKLGEVLKDYMEGVTARDAYQAGAAANRRL